MFAKSLIIFIGVGLVSGFVFGIYLIDVKNTGQLVYVEGTSLSIVTVKSDFKKDEIISIRLINSGTVPVSFSDPSHGLHITGLFGIPIYSPLIPEEKTISTLKAGQEIEFFWNQIKNDGNFALEGLYKISVKGFDDKGNLIEKYTTITIWK